MKKEKRKTALDFRDGLTINQGANGYRFSVDSVYLAEFAAFETGQNIIDIGTGTGIIPLLLIKRDPTLQVTGIEIQRELAELARENVRANGLQKQITIIHGDYRDPQALLTSQSWDGIVVNPPYYRLGEGRMSPNPGIAMARHEITSTLPILFSRAKSLLKKDACIYMAIIVERFDEIKGLAKKNSFQLKQVLPVYAKGKPYPYLLLIKMSKYVK